MKILTLSCLFLVLGSILNAQDSAKLGELPLPDSEQVFKQVLMSLSSLQDRQQYYNQMMPETVTLLNCQENQIDFWRLRRCCTDNASYVWSDTVVITVTDRITNWNTFPWVFAGTTKALVGSDSLPHTVNLRIADSGGQTVLNWETTVQLVPANWSYTVNFLWWVETLRTLRLVNFPPGNYRLIAELRATGYIGTAIEVPFTIDYPTSITETHAGTEIFLSQNYPNPFNASTLIRFSVPATSKTRLAVFNLLGQEVVCLVDETLTQGNYVASFEGTNLPSGTYIYCLTTSATKQTKLMILVK